MAQVEGDALVQEAQGVPHGAVRGLCDVAQGLLLHLHALLSGELPQPVRDGVDGDALEIISLAPGEDGDGELVHLRGGQDEDHIGGRLLQGLQQGVEGSCGQHMHLVDDVDLVLALRRGIGHFVYDFPYIVHAVVGGGVDLDYVHAGPCGDGTADAAFPAGALCRGVLAVHCPGQNLGHGGLARAAGAGEQIGMPDASCRQLVLQRGHDMVLAFYVRKGVRAELPV